MREKTNLIFALIIILFSSCKYPVVMRAKLMDDLSAIDLILYKNNEFKVWAHNPFGTTSKKNGKYRIEENKIIFLDKPYINDFIPDTVFIIDNKVIIEFKNDSIPNIDFARYFDIKTNRIN